MSAARFAPRLADRYMVRWTFDAQKTDTPADAERPDNLYAPVAHDGGARGRNWPGHTRRSSVDTKAMLHPAAAGAVIGGIATLVAVASQSTRRR